MYCFALAFLTIFISTLVGVSDVEASERISGTDRIGTAIEISKKGWTTTSSTVIIARADHPADALAAASLVATKDAPVLLVGKNLDQRVLNEISRLKARNIYLLGGTAAISPNVEASLRQAGLRDVTRISGGDRFQTANEINKASGLSTRSTAILVNGITVADALSASGISAIRQFPIYLSERDRIPVALPPSVKEVVIFGGPAAISPAVEQLLKDQGKTVHRIAGADRYDTSVRAGNWFTLNGANNILVRGTSISNGVEDYPDAVAASGLAKRLEAPIILTHPTNAPLTVQSFLSASDKNIIVLGGNQAVADRVVNQVTNKINHNQNVQFGTVNVSNTLNVRNAPTGTVIGSLTNGAKVEVHEQSNGWGKIRYGNGWGYISLSFVTLSKNPPQSSVLNKVIVIDAGHGGHDPGAVANGLQEKEVVLDISLRVEAKLRAAGANVVMTRRNDTFIELTERANIANRANASSFVSVHANAFNGSAHGSETYWLNSAQTSEDSRRLATAIQKHLINELATNDRGVKTANFSVLRNTNMPAALVEVGFLTNKQEAEKMKLASFREKAAVAIYKGILEYYNNK